MDTPLRLIADTPAMQGLVIDALTGHGVACHTQGDMVVVESGPRSGSGSGANSKSNVDIPQQRVIAVLRDALSGPEREAVSVVEALEFPHEFPVTTRLEAWWSVFETSWFEKALAADAFSVWFQPVVDTTARQTMGHECLLRLTSGPRREGGEIMATASARHDMAAFDAYTRQLAIRTASAQPNNDGVFFVNFMPSAMDRPEYCLRNMLQTLRETGLPACNVAMEAVQSSRNPDIAQLQRIGDYLREHGLRFSLDDVGANADALRLVCELRPDYIKLEKRLVHRMENPHEAAAVHKLVEVAERLNVRVVAKAVERVSTMEQLWLAGVQYMQGYLFGSPAPGISGVDSGFVN
jgi:EAL domain-containing protein (putative c-di-GMP-specific phosphodiesterase class I)